MNFGTCMSDMYENFFLVKETKKKKKCPSENSRDERNSWTMEFFDG